MKKQITAYKYGLLGIGSLFFRGYFAKKKIMRQLCLLVCLLFSVTAFSQTPDQMEELKEKIARSNASLDSSKRITDSIMLESTRRLDSANLARHMEQNTNNLVRFMNERDKKAKRGMWLRLGFGVLMLGVLIFGLLRKRKKKEIQ